MFQAVMHTLLLTILLLVKLVLKTLVEYISGGDKVRGEAEDRE